MYHAAIAIAVANSLLFRCETPSLVLKTSNNLYNLIPVFMGPGCGRNDQRKETFLCNNEHLKNFIFYFLKKKCYSYYIRGIWNSKDIKYHAVQRVLPTSDPSFSGPLSGGGHCYQFLMNSFMPGEARSILYVCICTTSPHIPHYTEGCILYTLFCGRRDKTIYWKNYVVNYEKTCLLKMFILVNLYICGFFVFCFFLDFLL